MTHQQKMEALNKKLRASRHLIKDTPHANSPASGQRVGLGLFDVPGPDSEADGAGDAHLEKGKVSRLTRKIADQDAKVRTTFSGTF